MCEVWSQFLEKPFYYSLSEGGCLIMLAYRWGKANRGNTRGLLYLLVGIGEIIEGAFTPALLSSL